MYLGGRLLTLPLCSQAFQVGGTLSPRNWTSHLPAALALPLLVMWFNYELGKGFLVEGT